MSESQRRGLVLGIFNLHPSSSLLLCQVRKKGKMLINKNTKIVGKKVVLVPYRKEHVLKYHEWMKSEDLQRLTASEPLSLEEEYEMQKSWMLDNNKCTFIILDKETYDSTGDEVQSMIGDTNLFFLSSGGEPLALVAEAEIMIAEPDARGKHCGWEAMLIMLYYGIIKLDVKQYIAKISADNQISIGMFEAMGFTQTSFSHVFNETTMEKLVDDTFKEWLLKSAQFQIEIERSEK